MKISRALLVLSSVSFGMAMAGCKSCVEQHDPRPIQEQFKREEGFAKAEQTLNPDGTIPAPKVTETSGKPAAPGQAKFEQFCSPCHGMNGKADGPGAAALNPKPRDFTDVAWQNKTDDTRIHNVIKNGGASVGLSANMAPWGAALSDAEIDDIIKWVRQFKGK